MDARIGQLRCRYRGPAGAGGSAAVARLERIAAERVSAMWADGLDEALGDDEAVYVVRQVRARLWLDVAAATDSAIAERWSRALRGAVARTVAADADDPSNVVRFADTAEFVAMFVRDLVAGVAWERWYYGAFARHRGAPLPAVLSAVLLEHRADLAAILAHLRRLRALDAVLDALGDEGGAHVWSGAPAPHAPRARDEAAAAWQPLLAAALRILGAAPGTDAPAAASAEILADWVRTAPAAPDWRDPAALADAVAAVARWLVTTGRVGARAAADPIRLRVAVAAEDWLDTARLGSALEAALPPPAPAAPGLPPRPPRPTPRQAALLADLAAAVASARSELDRRAPDSPANALRLLAALVEIDRRWATDEQARRAIGRFLAAWGALGTGRAARRVLAAVEAGDPAGVSLPLEPSARAEQRAAATAVAALGPAGSPLLAALRDAAEDAAPGDRRDSACAGVLLLVRALSDARIVPLAGAADYPPAGPSLLVAALGWRWAGPGAVAPDGFLDPAIAVLAGEDATTMARSRVVEAWQAVAGDEHDRWRERLMALLAAQPGGRTGDLPPADEVAGVLGHARTGSPGADRALDLTAVAVLRLWARWLRGFEHSSVPYLLDRFVRRPGRVVVADDRVDVELDRRPLDTVLEIAGYLRPFEPPPGAARRVTFSVREPR